MCDKDEDPAASPDATDMETSPKTINFTQFEGHVFSVRGLIKREFEESELARRQPEMALTG
jgi:hypothetical protein